MSAPPAPAAPGQPRTGRRTSDPRLRLRRRLVLLGLVPLLLATGLSVKIGVMLQHDREGRAALAQGSLERARAEFAANGELNWFESWVAPYDEGVALYRLDDAAGAVDAFSAALEVAPADRRCRVRINLALSQEALGDAAAEAGDASAGRPAWREGVRSLARDGCLTRDADTATAERRVARTVDSRLREKLAAREPEPPAPPEESEDEQEESEDAEDRRDQQLRERNRTGQENRQRQEQRGEERLDARQQRRQPAPTSAW